MLRWTKDVPSDNTDRCLPVLDLQVYWSQEPDKVVQHMFYRKQVSRGTTITASSAMSAGAKRSILVAKGLRRMYNTSPDIISSLKADLISGFNHDMFVSGHKYNFRVQIINKVLIQYANKVQKSGDQIMYRSRSQVIKEKSSKKFKNVNWFKERGYKAVLNIPVTPNGTLRKNIVRSLERQDLGDDFRLMVREVPEPQIQHLVSNVTQFNGTDNCARPNCLPCLSTKSGSKGSCWRPNPTYSIRCRTCLEDETVTTYVGESGYSAHYRRGLHQEGLRAEDHRSVLWEHMAHLHGARPGEGEDCIKRYDMKVTGSYPTSSKRLIAEAIRIEREVSLRDQHSRERDRKVKARIVLNSKSEWHQPAIIRIQARTTPNY